MNTTLDPSPKTRFYALDALRGIAALAVMFYHYTQHNGLNWLHGAWVAVDIFFILSGFVLMHSYGKKFLQGMTFRDFFISRIARLGPMYLVGLILGIVAAIMAYVSDTTESPPFYAIATTSTLNLFLLPYFNSQTWPFGDESIYGTVFPLNDPSWSLFFEMFVNIVFFYCLTQFKSINLKLLALGAGAIFVATTIYLHQVNPGATGKTFIYGFPRVTFEFFLGVIIYQFYNHYKLPPKFVIYSIFAVVALCFFSTLGAVALANSLIFAPILIAVFAKVVVHTTGENICKFLGDISYPLYVTHFPIYRILFESGFISNLDPVVETLLFSGISIGTAVVLVKIDTSIRNSFKRKRLASLQNA